MGRWSIISILTITQIFFLFSFWIRDYNTMIDQRIFFIEIKITKNDKFNGHVSEEKKKRKNLKSGKKWKKNKEKRRERDGSSIEVVEKRAPPYWSLHFHWFLWNIHLLYRNSDLHL